MWHGAQPPPVLAPRIKKRAGEGLVHECCILSCAPPPRPPPPLLARPLLTRHWGMGQANVNPRPPAASCTGNSAPHPRPCLISPHSALLLFSLLYNKLQATATLLATASCYCIASHTAVKQLLPLFSNFRLCCHPTFNCTHPALQQATGHAHPPSGCLLQCNYCLTSPIMASAVTLL